MSLKYVALTATAFALCAWVNSEPAAAQVPNCGEMYNRVMQLYQAAPYSPEYAQMTAAYGASCVGPSAGPAHPEAGPGYAAPAYGYAPGYAYGPPVGVVVGVGGGWGGGWRH
jgi:hypothetical protein